MTVPMPSPFNDDAPHFDGKGESLYDFLDEFELVASLAGLDGSTRMKKVWSYVCREEREFWRGTAKYHTTWESYKDDVISCYAVPPRVTKPPSPALLSPPSSLPPPSPLPSTPSPSPSSLLSLSPPPFMTPSHPSSTIPLPPSSSPPMVSAPIIHEETVSIMTLPLETLSMDPIPEARGFPSVDDQMKKDSTVITSVIGLCIQDICTDPSTSPPPIPHILISPSSPPSSPSPTSISLSISPSDQPLEACKIEHEPLSSLGGWKDPLSFPSTIHDPLRYDSGARQPPPAITKMDTLAAQPIEHETTPPIEENTKNIVNHVHIPILSRPLHHLRPRRPDKISIDSADDARPLREEPRTKLDRISQHEKKDDEGFAPMKEQSTDITIAQRIEPKPPDGATGWGVGNPLANSNLGSADRLDDQVPANDCSRPSSTHNSDPATRTRSPPRSASTRLAYDCTRRQTTSSLAAICVIYGHICFFFVTIPSVPRYHFVFLWCPSTSHLPFLFLLSFQTPPSLFISYKKLTTEGQRLKDPRRCR